MKKFIARKITDVLMSRHIILIQKIFGGRLSWLFRWAVKEDMKLWNHVSVPGGSILTRKK